MSYTHTTLTQLRALLAARLHDSSMVFFTSGELTAYIKEALRTFNALSGLQRARQTFPTVASTAFYDLPTQMSTELGYTVTDRNLINDIQYALLEPATSSWAGGWTGTEQFTMLDVQNALQTRLNQFLAETGLVVTRSTQAVPAPPAGRITLSDNVMDVRRVMWTDVPGTKTQLWQSDEWQASAYDYNWGTNTGTPFAFSVTSPPPLTLQLIPYSGDAGTLELLTVNTGATLDYTTGVTMGIPDDWAWVIKWGALANLLSKDGPGRDHFRADMCETRYRLGVYMARHIPCVLNAQLNGVSLFCTSLQELDAAQANWQNSAAAAAKFLGIAGYNLVGVSPIPSGVYSITVDVVRKFPVPSLDADYIEVGREQLNPILDYCEHLASFKMGGTELQQTNRLADNFLRQASDFNERMTAKSWWNDAVSGQSTRESFGRPKRWKGYGVGTLVNRQQEVANA